MIPEQKWSNERILNLSRGSDYLGMNKGTFYMAKRRWLKLIEDETEQEMFEMHLYVGSKSSAR